MLIKTNFKSISEIFVSINVKIKTFLSTGITTKTNFKKFLLKLYFCQYFLSDDDACCINYKIKMSGDRSLWAVTLVNEKQILAELPDLKCAICQNILLDSET